MVPFLVKYSIVRSINMMHEHDHRIGLCIGFFSGKGSNGLIAILTQDRRIISRPLGAVRFAGFYRGSLEAFDWPATTPPKT